MKRLFRLLFIATTVVAFTSCQKNYTCVCTYKDASGTPQSTSGTSWGSKKTARKDCTNNQNELRKIGSDVRCGLN